MKTKGHPRLPTLPYMYTAPTAVSSDSVLLLGRRVEGNYQRVEFDFQTHSNYAEKRPELCLSFWFSIDKLWRAGRNMITLYKRDRITTDHPHHPHPHPSTQTPITHPIRHHGLRPNHRVLHDCMLMMKTLLKAAWAKNRTLEL